MASPNTNLKHYNYLNALIGRCYHEYLTLLCQFNPIRKADETIVDTF